MMSVDSNFSYGYPHGSDFPPHPNAPT